MKAFTLILTFFITVLSGISCTDQHFHTEGDDDTVMSQSVENHDHTVHNCSPLCACQGTLQLSILKSIFTEFKPKQYNSPFYVYQENFINSFYKVLLNPPQA